MTQFAIADGIKQTVITRLATINSAISILDITNGKPAHVTVEDVLAMAERIEDWAWRGLGSEEQLAHSHGNGQPSDKPTDAGRPDALNSPPPADGKKPQSGDASDKQIAAIFAIGKKKGHSADDIKTWVQRKCHKTVSSLTSREASSLIDDLEAL